MRYAKPCRLKSVYNLWRHKVPLRLVSNVLSWALSWSWMLRSQENTRISQNCSQARDYQGPFTYTYLRIIEVPYELSNVHTIPNIHIRQDNRLTKSRSKSYNAKILTRLFGADYRSVALVVASCLRFLLKCLLSPFRSRFSRFWAVRSRKTQFSETFTALRCTRDTKAVIWHVIRNSQVGSLCRPRRGIVNAALNYRDQLSFMAFFQHRLTYRLGSSQESTVLQT